MRMQRTFPCAVLAAALCLVAWLPSSPEAADDTDREAWQFELQLPRSSQTALQSGEGLAWATFLQNGLTLTARGSDKIEVVVFVLEVQDGRVIQRWSSSVFTASAGTSSITGRQFPAVRATGVDRTSRVQQATPAMRPVDTAALVDANTVATVVPRDLARGRLFVIFAAPQRSGAGSTTSPLFVDFEQHID